jgi:hypothetical protein
MLSLLTGKEFLTSIISGLITSVIFLMLLWKMKPSITISDKICCEKTILNNESVKLFYF